MRACYFDFYWGLPQPLLTPNSSLIRTARCSRACGSAKMKPIIYMVYTMSTNTLLTPCKQGAVLSRYSLLPVLGATRCKQRAVHCLFNERIFSP